MKSSFVLRSLHLLLLALGVCLNENLYELIEHLSIAH